MFVGDKDRRAAGETREERSDRKIRGREKKITASWGEYFRRCSARGWVEEVRHFLGFGAILIPRSDHRDEVWRLESCSEKCMRPRATLPPVLLHILTCGGRKLRRGKVSVHLRASLFSSRMNSTIIPVHVKRWVLHPHIALHHIPCRLTDFIVLLWRNEWMGLTLMPSHTRYTRVHGQSDSWAAPVPVTHAAVMISVHA